MKLSALTPSTLALIAVVVLATGCAAEAPEASASGASTQDASTATSETGFPIMVTNCGREVTVESAPKRILMVNNDAISLVASLGALDRVVGLTSELLPDVYPEEYYTALSGAEQLRAEKNATGGSVVTQESILALQPDLVLAPDTSVDRDALAEAGIPTYSPPAYCAEADPALSGPASFDGVYHEVENYGKLLGEQDAAATEIEKLKESVSGLADPTTDLGTAAALYVSTTGVLSAYGASSMISAQFEAAGLTNVYQDEAQRVFDISAEDLLTRNPDTIVLLYSGSSASETIAGFQSAPGVDALAAVKADRVLVLPFPFTDPPTPMSIVGAEKLAAELAELS